jgi:hypothetical protein
MLLASRSLRGGEQDNAQFKLALTEKETTDLAEYLKSL